MHLATVTQCGPKQVEYSVVGREWCGRGCSSYAKGASLVVPCLLTLSCCVVFLSLRSDYGGALRHFEEALAAGGDTLDAAMTEVCHAGIARAAIRTGDIRR